MSALDPTLPLVQWTTLFFNRGKRQWLSVYHTPPTNTEVENRWSNTSTPPLCLHWYVRSRPLQSRSHHLEMQCFGFIQIKLPFKIIFLLEQQNCYYADIILINPLNPELNPICYFLALLAHHFLHVSRIRVKSLTLRSLTLYIYGAPILDVSRSHTTTQHSR